MRSTIIERANNAAIFKNKNVLIEKKRRNWFCFGERILIVNRVNFVRTFVFSSEESDCDIWHCRLYHP